MTQTRTAFIAIVGCPNVGKSSILNRLLGQKVAVVSPKPQTTRTKIMGVLTEDEVQLVFTDTPGFHRPRTKLGEKMIKAVSDSISGVDACLFVVEPSGELRDAEKDLLKKFKDEKMPVILAINKIDSVKQKELLIERMAQFSALYDFEAIVPCSALKGDGFGDLKDELFKQAQPSPHFFPDDTLTDQPERVLAGEIIRRLLRTGVTRFRALFQGNRSRSEVVATFLAVLELCKAHRLRLAGTEEDCTITSTQGEQGDHLEVTADSFEF